MLDWIDVVVKLVKEFGFPAVVAGWAIWRLDRILAKGEGTQARLEELEESADRIEMKLDKLVEINQEMIVTIKIFNNIMGSKNYGGDDK